MSASFPPPTVLLASLQHCVLCLFCSPLALMPAWPTRAGCVCCVQAAHRACSWSEQGVLSDHVLQSGVGQANPEPQHHLPCQLGLRNFWTPSRNTLWTVTGPWGFRSYLYLRLTALGRAGVHCPLMASMCLIFPEHLLLLLPFLT